MAPNPIIFAMANPDPEITPEEAHAVRGDVMIATGRSDYPNQVNNVLGFPFIFRGALDVRASCINEEMKLAAVHALAELAREECPDSVCKAYGNVKFAFGRDYIIPKPFDPRVLLRVAPAIAQAAMDTGVARQPIDDMDKYIEQLEALQGKSKEIMRMIINKAKSDPKRIVFPEGDNEKILRAAQILVEEGIAIPILIGNADKIRAKMDHRHRAERLDHRPRDFGAHRGVRRGAVPPAPAQRCHSVRSAAHHTPQIPQPFRLHDGAHGRCGHPALRHRHPLPRDHQAGA